MTTNMDTRKNEIRYIGNMIKLKEGQNLIKSIIFYPAHPILRQVIIDIEKEYKRYDVELVITEWHRNPRHPGDIHAAGPPQRALDLRIRNLPQDIPAKIAETINKKYIYDPKRPAMKVVVYGDKAHLNHFHVQVHPRTQKTGEV